MKRITVLIICMMLVVSLSAGISNKTSDVLYTRVLTSPC